MDNVILPTPFTYHYFAEVEWCFWLMQPSTHDDELLLEGNQELGISLQTRVAHIEYKVVTKDMER